MSTQSTIIGVNTRHDRTILSMKKVKTFSSLTVLNPTINIPSSASHITGNTTPTNDLSATLQCFCPTEQPLMWFKIYQIMSQTIPPKETILLCPSTEIFGSIR